MRALGQGHRALGEVDHIGIAASGPWRSAIFVGMALAGARPTA